MGEGATLLKYLGEIAPVLLVLGWWVMSLQKALKEKQEDLKHKDEQLFKEIEYTKERDKENLKAVIESAAILKTLSEALRQSEGSIVAEVRDRTETLKENLERSAADIKNHIDTTLRDTK